MSNKIYAIRQMQLICFAGGMLLGVIAWFIYIIFLVFNWIKVWSWL